MYQEEIDRRLEVLSQLNSQDYEAMKEIEDLIVDTILNGGKVLTAGNGGSAANAQHVAGELIGRYKKERSAWSAISLNVDPSVVTAISNDYGYENLFKRQVEGLGNKNDLLIVMSSSAESKNIDLATKKAQEKGLKVVAFLGNFGGEIINNVDVAITFPFNATDLFEEISMSMLHIILGRVEESLIDYKR